MPLILDTNVLIDGRIEGLLETGLISEPMLIPDFVIAELSLLHDMGDSVKKRSAERGIIAAERIAARFHPVVQRISWIARENEKVDDLLLRAALSFAAGILTNDSALAARARIQGSRAVLLSDVCRALRNQDVHEGMVVELYMEQRGQKPDQATSRLEDGTPVVVNDAADLVGKSAQCRIAGVIQTSGGPLVFARVVQ